MKINSFKAEGVHDYLKFDLTFYPDLTFLIGINGSGKTSALKLILGLTSPAFHYLNQINYKLDFPLKQTTPFRWKETTPKLTTFSKHFAGSF